MVRAGNLSTALPQLICFEARHAVAEFVIRKRIEGDWKGGGCSSGSIIVFVDKVNLSGF